MLPETSWKRIIACSQSLSTARRAAHHSAAPGTARAPWCASSASDRRSGRTRARAQILLEVALARIAVAAAELGDRGGESSSSAWRCWWCLRSYQLAGHRDRTSAESMMALELRRGAVARARRFKPGRTRLVARRRQSNCELFLIRVWVIERRSVNRVGRDAQVIATGPGRPHLRQLDDELYRVANERREVGGGGGVARAVAVDRRRPSAPDRACGDRASRSRRRAIDVAGAGVASFARSPALRRPPFDGTAATCPHLRYHHGRKTQSIKRKRASFDAALLWLSAAGGYTPCDEERLLRSEAVQMIAWLYELTPHEVAMCFWRVLTMTD